MNFFHQTSQVLQIGRVTANNSEYHKQGGDFHMEESRWKQVHLIVRRLARRKTTHEKFGDADIVEVFYWSVIHDRPQGWATCLKNWPIHLRRGRSLPSQGTLSRRLRSQHVQRLLKRIEEETFKIGMELPLVHFVDGKPLV